jgi:tRNA threonylcarbamoyladenosine biosynthesis protein TsaE
MHLHTRSVEETLEFGRLLGQLAAIPPALTCIALDGPLGAGKTHLTRGIAEGAGVDDPSLVSSPTYVLMNIYTGPKPIWHLDAYRVASEEELASLGLEEILTPPTVGGNGGGILIVEWASRVPALLPSDHLQIAIEHEAESQRSFELTSQGEVSKTLLNHLSHRMHAQRQQAQQQQ